MAHDPLARISREAQLGSDVVVGPFCVIESGAVIGDRCQLSAHVTVKSGVTLGADNVIEEGAVLGGRPQHLNRIEHPGPVVIGDRNVIREHVTVHKAMHSDGVTRIGSDCLLMVGSHVAHDCRLGSNVVLTNHVLLAGHVQVGDRAYLGGGAAVHQYCRVGRLAMVGGLARVAQDIPPFVMIDGDSSLSSLFIEPSCEESFCTGTLWTSALPRRSSAEDRCVEASKHVVGRYAKGRRF